MIALWDSEQSWERFRDEKLLPALGEMGHDGFPSPPEETTFEVHTAQQG